MSNQDRRFGDFESIKCSAVAAMRDVERHSYFIHPIDDGNAEITDSIVAPLRASVADQVASVIGQQGYALPELIETIDVVRGPKMLRVLQPQIMPILPDLFAASMPAASSTRMRCFP